MGDTCEEILMREQESDALGGEPTEPFRLEGSSGTLGCSYNSRDGDKKLGGVRC